MYAVYKNVIMSNKAERESDKFEARVELLIEGYGGI